MRFVCRQSGTLGATRTNNPSAHSAALGPAPPSLVRGHRQAKSKNHWVVANLVDFMKSQTRHIPQVLTNVTRIYTHRKIVLHSKNGDVERVEERAEAA